MDILTEYIHYHAESSLAKDIDPSNDCLGYICDRYELNKEQRYWMAFLYASTYSAATAFYMYNEFPDYENVDVDRMRRWWDANKHKTIFQTDRKWIKSRNQFVDSFVSYRDFVGSLTQEQRFAIMDTGNPYRTYNVCMNECERIFTFGRFTLFLYLDNLNFLTGFNIQPDKLNLNEAESSRNGLCYAIGDDDLMNHYSNRRLTKGELDYLDARFMELYERIQYLPIQHKNIWNIETTLCAFKKHKMGKRFVGYYIQRQAEEIQKLQNLVTEGVDWSVLWQFRKETYNEKYTKADCNRW